MRRRSGRAVTCLQMNPPRMRMPPACAPWREAARAQLQNGQLQNGSADALRQVEERPRRDAACPERPRRRHRSAPRPVGVVGELVSAPLGRAPGLPDCPFFWFLLAGLCNGN